MSLAREIPVPRPEPGAHFASAVALDVDRDGRFVVTAARDGTARLWSADDGAPARVLRRPGPPEGDAAAAISPDGETIAVAGVVDGFPVHLFGRVDGRIRRNLPGAGAAIRRLVFSLDGRRLAVVTTGTSVVWSVVDGAPFPMDTGSVAAEAIAFDRAGRAAIVGVDGVVRLFDARGARLAERTVPPGPGRPVDVAFAPDGREVAVGFADAPRVEILSGSDLTPLLTPAAEGLEGGDLSRVRWSANGRRLYAGGRPGSRGALHVWPWNGRDRVDPDIGAGSVTALRAMIPDGALIALDTGEWLRLDYDDVPATRVPPAGASFPGAAEIGVSFDGTVVELPLVEGFLRVDLAARRCDRTATRGADAAPGGISGDGRIAAVRGEGGLVHWKRADDGRTLLSLFAHADGRRWAAWTPSGYHTASPGGDALFGMLIGNGPDREADFLTAGRLAARYARHDVALRVLATGDEGEALLSVEREAARASLPPSLRVVSPEEGTRVAGDSVLIGFDVTNSLGVEGGGDVLVGVRVDGRPIAGEPVFRVTPGRTTRVAVPLPPAPAVVSGDEVDRIVHVTLHPSTPDGRTGEPDTVSLALGPDRADRRESGRRPRLFVVAHGVSDHADGSLRLRFAHKDALDIAAFFEWRKSQGPFAETNIRLRTDRHVTRETLREDLEWLRAGVEAEDTALVFLFGHGVSDESGRFVFLTSDVDPHRPATRGFDCRELVAALRAVRGGVAAFLDVCREGGPGEPPDVDPLVNELAAVENGVAALSATSGRCFSLEETEWRNGVFAKALLEGLDGSAEGAGEAIRLSDLAAFTRRRVIELTAGRQVPGTALSPVVRDLAPATRATDPALAGG